jgi:hypothetical protein
MTCVTHCCADTADATTRNDTARLRALALAALVEHPASRTVPVDELVAAAAGSTPAPTLART